MGQSTGASNRIENISTSNKRLRELMLEKAEPKNRDEREIAGYRYVLDLIHESHGGIPDPFNDGNGRMSRLLTLLLMYRSGYDVEKYVSLEKEIECTKETHYEALATSSQGWQEGKNGYAPSSPTCSASSTPATESSPTGSLSWAPPRTTRRLFAPSSTG